MVELAGQDPVRDHRVDVVAEQREIGVRAARLGDDETLGVHDEPRARDVAVGQQLAHAVEPVVEAAHRAEHAFAGHRNARDALHDRPDHLS